MDGFDDLESALGLGPGRSSASKPSISNLNAIFGTESTPKSATKKPSVSFQDTTTKSTSSLDALFADTIPKQSAEPSRPSSRSSRQRAEPGSLSSMFSASRTSTATPTVSTSAPSTSAAAPVQQTSQESAVGHTEALRIQRLEAEIERLNREIDDLKRRKKADEDDLEQMWKTRLSKKDADHRVELAEQAEATQRQLAKINGEHAEELERLRSTYERQLDSLQSAAGQSRDISTIVDKVDTISSTLGKLTTDAISGSEKKFMETETSLKLRQQALDHREDKLRSEQEAFQNERMKVYELNAKLQELCKGQEGVLEQDKWKVRDEWNRLNAEKQVFKEEQKYIMDALERQREGLEKSKTSFLKEQHDLLMRVSAERTSMELERDEFIKRRNLDVRRLKEEASELQSRIEAVQGAEAHAEELRRHFEAKLNQLQELEIALMEECVALENYRETLAEHHSVVGGLTSGKNTKRSEPEQASIPRPHSPQLPKRHPSVRTNLRKHSEFLERYIGQKVAAVSPHNVFRAARSTSRNEMLN